MSPVAEVHVATDQHGRLHFSWHPKSPNPRDSTATGSIADNGLDVVTDDDRMMLGKANLRNLGKRRKRERPRERAESAEAAFYRRYPPRVAVPIVDRRLAISHDWKYVYARIPKAANSTVVATLHAVETGRSIIAEIGPIKRSFAAFSQLDEQGLERVEADDFRFSFVRNPYTRILSAYLDKIAGGKRVSGGKRGMVTGFLGRSPHADVALADFVDHLEFGDGVRSNGHWAPQVDMLVMPPERFDHIGRVEQLEAGMHEVTSRIFGSPKRLTTFYPHATSAGERIGMMDEHSRRRLARLHEEDLNTFHDPTGFSRGPSPDNS